MGATWSRNDYVPAMGQHTYLQGWLGSAKYPEKYSAKASGSEFYRTG